MITVADIFGFLIAPAMLYIAYAFIKQGKKIVHLCDHTKHLERTIGDLDEETKKNIIDIALLKATLEAHQDLNHCEGKDKSDEAN